MSNHSQSCPDPEMQKALDAALADAKPLQDQLSELGATGRFPLGKITEKDEGELAFRIGAKDDRVVIDFGAPVAWVGLTPDQADQIADSLKDKAAALRVQGATERLEAIQRERTDAE